MPVEASIPQTAASGRSEEKRGKTNINVIFLDWVSAPEGETPIVIIRCVISTVSVFTHVTATT